MGKTSIADHMVIASGQSRRHLSTLAEHVIRDLKTRKYPAISVEGQEQCEWIVIDFGDVIVHLFKPDVRDRYNLEKMWDFNMPADEKVNVLM